jgi:signal transduction histidine kinase
MVRGTTLQSSPAPPARGRRVRAPFTTPPEPFSAARPLFTRRQGRPRQALPTLPRMPKANAIDWSQLWYPGPKRAFTTEEMARAGSDPPSATLVTIAGINAALLAFIGLQVAPASETARLTGMLAAFGMLGWVAARWLWWRPWRRPLMQVCVGILVLQSWLSLSLRWIVGNTQDRLAVHWVLVTSVLVLAVMLWFLVVWRAQQIESRLAEQAERERAIEMARRLAAAQLEPHFLFNTLASLQHWVHTQDARAAPLLDALTGYLRATLPMFSRALQPAADELQAVRLYLQVMQARLGTRLQWQLDVPAELQAQALPPGLLLTLVENAIEHGISPQLAGGQLWLRGRIAGADAVFEVQDDGPGLATDSRDGIGLTNNRERLALTCGPAATLTLSAHADGGCLARLQLPRKDL